MIKMFFLVVYSVKTFDIYTFRFKHDANQIEMNQAIVVMPVTYVHLDQTRNPAEC